MHSQTQKQISEICLGHDLPIAFSLWFTDSSHQFSDSNSCFDLSIIGKVHGKMWGKLEKRSEKYTTGVRSDHDHEQVQRIIYCPIER